MILEPWVSFKVVESLGEKDKRLRKVQIRSREENKRSWHSVRSPLSVEVVFNVLMEEHVTTTDCFSANALSNISVLSWRILQIINRVSLMRLEEVHKVISRAWCCHF